MVLVLRHSNLDFRQAASQELRIYYYKNLSYRRGTQLPILHKFFRCSSGGALKMQDQKMHDLKIKDQISGPKNAGSENAGPSKNAASLC